MSTDTLDIKELLNKVGWIAFLAGKTSPDDENKDNYYKQSEISIKRAEQALNLYIEERVREGKIEELNYTEDKMFDESASKGEWGIPTKWSKEKYGGENYADLWTPNEVVHKVFQNRLKELENTLPRGLKGDI